MYDMSRQIQAIRDGLKHGPVHSYMTSANVADLNPFVLWDHFYIPHIEQATGFGFHGHSGVATISYPQKGSIAHEDTGGHSGFLEAGGIQIMSAGAGVLHKEIIHPTHHVADAFQLWVALPAEKQEMGPVTYSTLPQNGIPIVETPTSTTKVLVGTHNGVHSTAQAPVDMTYLHINIDAEDTWQHSENNSQTTAFVFVRHGSIEIGNKQISAGELGIFEKNMEPIDIKATQQKAEFLFISGTPLQQAFVSNGSSIHSSTKNLIAGVQRIKQLHLQKVQTTHPQKRS